MFSPTSPFRNLPLALDRKQAFFLDGMRHAIEIADVSFRRLSNNLEELSRSHQDRKSPNETFAVYFLDAWAFVDAPYRFSGLWKLQPEATTLPEEYSTRSIDRIFKPIANIRNASDHIAQKADQVISSQTAALGVLTWATILEEQPLKVATYLMAPGIIGPSVKEQLDSSAGVVRGTSRSVNIHLRAGPYKTNLSEAYYSLTEIASFADKTLSKQLANHGALKSYGADILMSAHLKTDESSASSDLKGFVP